MENYYKKTKPLSIISLIFITIIFIWQLINLITNISGVLPTNHDSVTRLMVIYNNVESFFSFLIAVFVLVYLNILILTETKKKTLLIIILSMGTAIIALRLLGNFSSIIQTILYSRIQISIGKGIINSIIIITLNGILFTITLVQFLNYFKVYSAAE